MPASDQFAPAPPAPPAPRKRSLIGKLFRFAIILMVAGLVVIGCLIGYLQTGHAFKRIIVPAVARATGARIQVDSGSISLAGRLRARGLKLTQPATGARVTAKEIYVSVDPKSLAGGTPRIRELIIDTAEIVQPVSPAPAPEETETLAESTSSPSSPSRPQSPSRPSRNADDPYLPVVIDRARVTDSKLTLLDGERENAVFTTHELEVTDLAPGRGGSIKGDGGFLLSPDDAQARREGVIEFGVDVTQGARGTEVEWKGSGVARVKRGADFGDVKVENLTLDFKTEGLLKGLESARSMVEMAARISDEDAGKVKAEMEWSADGGVTQSSVELKNVTREIPNLFLAATGPAQFESAAFEGTLKATREEGGGYRIESTLTGRELSLKPDADKPATPRVDFSSEQALAWNPERATARFDVFDVKLSRGGAEVARAAIAEPTLIQLPNPGQDAAGEKEDVAPEKAALTLDVKDLSVDDLRPWAALANNKDLDKLESGRFNGKLTINVAERGARLDLKGRVKGDEVRIAAEEKNEAARRTFSVDQTLDITSNQFKTIVIRSADAKIAADGRALGSLGLSGDVGLEEGTLALNVTLGSEDMIASAERLGVSFEEKAVRPVGGSLEGVIRVTRKGREALVSARGEARIARLALTREGRRLTRDASIKFDVQSESSSGRVRLGDTRLELKDGSAAAGVIDLNVDWPGKGSEGAGSVTAKIRQLDAKPWMDFMGVMEDRDIARAPLEADLKITTDKDERVTIKGEERIGPIRLGGGKVASEDVTIQLAQEFSKLGDTISDFLVTYTAERKGSAPDRIQARGSADLSGDKPDIRADVVIASLAPEIYLDKADSGAARPASAPSTKSKAGAPAEAAKSDSKGGGKGSAEAGASGPPLRWNGPIKIERLQWGGLTAASNVRMETIKDRMRWNIDSLTLAGGDVAGDAEMIWSGSGSSYAWDLKGSNLDAAKLVGGLNPDYANKITGVAAFNTSGRGALGVEDPKKEVTGALTFNLKDGRLLQSSLLEEIAKATGSELFREVQFATFEGDVALGGGKADVKEAKVTGPVARLLARGSVDFEGPLDMRITPGVGQSALGRLQDNKYFERYGALLPKSDGYVMFPLAVRVAGTTSKPRYGVDLDLPTVRDSIENLLDEGIGDTIQNLVGGKKKKKSSEEDAAPAPEEEKDAEPSSAAPTPKPEPEEAVKDVIDGVIGGIRKLRKK